MPDTMPLNKDWWSSLAGNTNTSSTPAFQRISSIPDWLPKNDTSELQNQYQNVNKMFDTSAYDTASENQQSRLLTTALNAGDAAASDYANRARQAGGSMLGTGLIKAQAQVGARKSAGEMALEKEKFDASQREKAAGLSSQIAQTLAGLRDSYLKSIVGYATSEDATMADFTSKQQAAEMSKKQLEEQAREFNLKQPQQGSYLTDNSGKVVKNSVYGTPFRDPITGIPTGVGNNNSIIPGGVGFGG